MSYLIVMSVGPVQEFIASARRSRDLWFGSWLLSEISKAAAKKIADKCGISSLIFPSVEIDNAYNLDPVTYDEKRNRTSGTDFSVVNKIVALVDADPHQLCEGEDGIYAAMKSRLEKIRVDAYNGIKGKNHIDDVTAKEQISDLIEFYWAAVEDDIGYGQAREEAEALIAARKNLRDFRDTSKWSSNKPKSSLDGLRESVIKESAPLDKEQRRKQLDLREGEQLCGVGLLKRHGNRQGDDSFFSTSHVAAKPLMESLRDGNAINENKKAFNEYIKKLKELGVQDNDLNSVPVPKGTNPHPVFGRNDGHLLFRERLSEFFNTNAEDKTEATANKKKLERAKEFLSKLLKDELKVKAPKPYYALLHADGDRMGEAIDERQSPEDHKRMSARLSAFATEAQRFVEVNSGGSLVYSGGDDVLAFLPLHQALFCARNLADEFRTAMSKFSYTKDGKPIHPTLSVGIAVGHHLDPLQDTLELARQAEKAAKKQVKDKNALAIIVSKRSGVDWLVKGSWQDSSSNEQALDNRLNYFIYLHLAEALPRGVGYELRDAALRLHNMKDALSAEARRIIKRKRSKDGRLKEEVFNRMESYVNELSIEDLAYQLIVTRTFADAMNQAGMNANTFAAKAGFKELNETEEKK